MSANDFRFFYITIRKTNRELCENVEALMPSEKTVINYCEKNLSNFSNVYKLLKKR